MELVRLTGERYRDRRRQARNRSHRFASYEENLLSGQDALFVDEWDWSSPPGRSRRRRPAFRQLSGDHPPPILPTGAPKYRPPKPPGDYYGGGNNDEEGPDYALYLNGPAPPSLSRAIRRQTPARTTQTAAATKVMSRSEHYGVNPAVDMGGGLLSYGFGCAQCVRTQEVGVTENCGEFQEILPPGFYCLVWPFSDVAGRLSLRIQQLDVICETKTKDNVFVHIKVTVQFRVIVGKAYDAFYRLTDPCIQIKSYVFDVVRSTVPHLTIDEVFSSKSSIANHVLNRLKGVMQDYGYEILDALVTDISPDQKVRESMNEMQASKRLKEAMPHRAEAEKVKIVKAAEASAEATYLSGVGSANERVAMVKGMKECVSTWMEDQHVSSKDVMDLLLITQYIDTLAVVGSNEIFLRYGPGEVFAVQKSLPTTHHIPDLLW